MVDPVAIGALGVTVFGGIFGFMWHLLSQVKAVLEVKNAVIDSKDKTIETQDRQILLLEATGNAANQLLSTMKVVAQGGSSP